MTQKHNHAKAILLALLLVLGMIVSPVSALGYEITAEPLGGVLNPVAGKISNLTIDVSPTGDAVQRIAVDVGTGTTVNFTLWYGNGATVTGWMVYTNDGFFQQHSEVAIDSDISGYNYIGLQEIGRIDIVGYARNWTSNTQYTTGFIVYDSVFGVSERRAMAYYPVAALSDNVIYKFQLTSSKPVAVAYYTNTRENVGKASTLTPIEAGNEWISLALKYSGSVLAFIAGLFWVLKFLFIDNLLLIIALYLMIPLAVALCTSRDIFQAIGRYFQYQKKFIDFIISLWSALWSILNYLVQIFVKWL